MSYTDTEVRGVVEGNIIIEKFLPNLIDARVAERGYLGSATP